jgi:hypothetical protein
MSSPEADYTSGGLVSADVRIATSPERGAQGLDDRRLRIEDLVRGIREDVQLAVGQPARQVDDDGGRKEGVLVTVDDQRGHSDAGEVGRIGEVVVVPMVEQRDEVNPRKKPCSSSTGGLYRRPRSS